MMTHDPDPDKRITNADEQDVAVNHSTRQEGGYDEPVSEAGEATPEKKEEGPTVRRNNDEKKRPSPEGDKAV